MIMCRYFLCFIFYSFIGWAYECIFYSVQNRKFVNSGFLNGCLCPIYGIGALLILIFLGNIKNPVTLFFTGMLVTGILEYFTSWFLEEIFHERWWDYTGWAFNINGRVCLLGALAFGTMTVLLVKAINPFTLNIINRLPLNMLYGMTFLAAMAVLTDTVITVRHIDLAPKKLWFVRRQSEFAERCRKYIHIKLNSIFGNDLAESFSDDEDGLMQKIKKILYK